MSALWVHCHRSVSFSRNAYATLTATAKFPITWYLITWYLSFEGFFWLYLYVPYLISTRNWREIRDSYSQAEVKKKSSRKLPLMMSDYKLIIIRLLASDSYIFSWYLFKQIFHKFYFSWVRKSWGHSGGRCHPTSRSSNFPRHYARSIKKIRPRCGNRRQCHTSKRAFYRCKCWSCIDPRTSENACSPRDANRELFYQNVVLLVRRHLRGTIICVYQLALSMIDHVNYKMKEVFLCRQMLCLYKM